MSWGCFPRYCLRTAVRLSSALASSSRGNGESRDPMRGCVAHVGKRSEAKFSY